jgi:hypothetical protein
MTPANLVKHLHTERRRNIHAALRVDRHAVGATAGRRVRHMNIEITLLVDQRSVGLNLEDPRELRSVIRPIQQGLVRGEQHTVWKLDAFIDDARFAALGQEPDLLAG